MRCLAGIATALLLALLAGCVPQRSVRVEPVEGPRPRSVPAGLYEVVRGDTLYGIAFRHGLDYRELAAINSIAAPYTIYPGQRLRLSGPATRSGPPAVASAPAPGTAAPVVAPIVSSPPVRTTPATPSTVPPATAATEPSPSPASPAATAVDPPAQPATPAPPTSTPPAAPGGAPRWQWPADGALIGRFLAGDPTRQGIGLAGRGGDPVRAAADGVVVYSGAGLIGYGELIIVKHNDTWLSAYGHNRKRLVAEGEAVRGGQRIAEIGRTGASRDMLHFEVRRNGRPVDPLGVLPPR